MKETTKETLVVVLMLGGGFLIFAGLASIDRMGFVFFPLGLFSTIFGLGLSKVWGIRFKETTKEMLVRVLVVGGGLIVFATIFTMLTYERGGVAFVLGVFSTILGLRLSKRWGIRFKDGSRVNDGNRDDLP